MSLSFNSCHYQRYQFITRLDDTVFDRFGNFTAYAYTLFAIQDGCKHIFHYVLILPTAVKKESTEDIGYIVL